MQIFHFVDEADWETENYFVIADTEKEAKEIIKADLKKGYDERKQSYLDMYLKDFPKDVAKKRANEAMKGTSDGKDIVKRLRLETTYPLAKGLFVTVTQSYD